MADRASLPHWPRLMSAAMAATYLSMSAAAFRNLGIVPVEANGRKVLYDRRSLDIYADRLSGLVEEDEGDLEERFKRFGQR